MNRRGFLRSLIGGVATAAAVRMFPFRVYSFPENVLIRKGLGEICQWDQPYTWIVNPEQLAAIQALELEKVREEIPVMLANESLLFRYIKQHRTIVQLRGEQVLGLGSGSHWNAIPRKP
jgi:hypothetical protein